ncbi:DUF4328 domain-containing protein [Hymenobacter sp. J193]|uniref:DUF4328 domain-containing protein n=1 Tax=Hymenobacter sp. J193 TaxID=2898429 RepID=UPI002150C2EA|nr:DUF4328 domain-containing protein [Hymenobacter sp. J193]MCR5889953.1 DUF4328 domain-containing protein [Hymenobacter sp. J193]
MSVTSTANTISLLDNRFRLRFVLVLLWLSGGVALVSFALNGWQFLLNYRLSHGTNTLTPLQKNGLALVWTEVLQVFVGFLTMLASALWSHRAYANIYRLRQFRPQFGAWYIGWLWVIPLFSLFRPFQVMEDIFSSLVRNAPSSGGSLPRAWYRLLAWWWMLHLIPLVGSRALQALYPSQTLDPDRALQQNGFVILLMALTAVDTVLALRLFRRLGALEREVAQQVGVAR